jgi:hypothetical protein
LNRTLTIALLLVLSGCTTTQTTSNNNGSAPQPAPSQAPSQPAAASQAPSQPSAPATAKPLSDVQEGEASGTIVVEGLTIPVKYAYAGHTEMFHEDAIVILVTEMPIPPEDLAKAFEGSSGRFSDVNRGLEYEIGKGFWVRYHPGAFQTSGNNTLKDYSVENGIVRGRDEDSTNFDGKEYKRSVSFIARVQDKQK